MQRRSRRSWGANIGITLDLYGHLMPGAEAEAAGLLDAYLKRSEEQARAADPRDSARDNGHLSPAVLSGS